MTSCNVQVRFLFWKGGYSGWIYAVLLLFIAFYLKSTCVPSTSVPTYPFIFDWQTKRPLNKRWGGSLFPEVFTWYPGYTSSNVSYYYSCFKLDTRFKMKNERPRFVSFGTFTQSAFIHLMWAAAFVLQDLNDHSSGTSVAAGGFKTPPLQAGQLAGAPRRPNC